MLKITVVVLIAKEPHPPEIVPMEYTNTYVIEGHHEDSKALEILAEHMTENEHKSHAEHYVADAENGPCEDDIPFTFTREFLGDQFHYRIERGVALPTPKRKPRILLDTNRPLNAAEFFELIKEFFKEQARNDLNSPLTDGAATIAYAEADNFSRLGVRDFAIEDEHEFKINW